MVVVVVDGGGQGSHTLPAPTLVPPPAAQVASSRAMWGWLCVQSAFTSQARVASLEQVPAFVPSPGIGSLHVPVSLTQHRTASALPHVERAAQRARVCRAWSVRHPAFRNALRVQEGAARAARGREGARRSSCSCNGASSPSAPLLERALLSSPRRVPSSASSPRRRSPSVRRPDGMAALGSPP